jgi:large subunit ribosomal protein L23
MTENEVQDVGVVLEAYQVLLRPLVTEKNVHKSEKLNQYTFEIHPLATKLDVAQAIADLFNVKVLKVRTQTRRGKSRRYKFRKGVQKDWKKAIVTLHDESRIDFY